MRPGRATWGMEAREQRAGKSWPDFPRDVWRRAEVGGGSAGLLAARLSACWGSVGAEERTQFFGVEFGFFEGGEVAAAGWFGEADEVGGSFEPGPGRGGAVAGAQRNAGGALGRGAGLGR